MNSSDGSGIGLSLVKELIAYYQGTIILTKLETGDYFTLR